MLVPCGLVEGAAGERLYRLVSGRKRREVEIVDGDDLRPMARPDLTDATPSRSASAITSMA